MIRLSDAVLLSATKLRAHIIRTTITILAVGLLFAIPICFSLISGGLFASVDDFSRDGLTDRYIVRADKAFSGDDELMKRLRDPKLIATVKQKYSALIKEKQAMAEELGIPYDVASEFNKPYIDGALTGGKTMLNLGDSTGIVRSVLFDAFADDGPAFDDEKLHEIAARYHATNFFSNQQYDLTPGASLEVLPSDGEKFVDQTEESQQTGANTQFIEPLLEDSMTIKAPELASPFMLTDAAGWKPDSGIMPIILPQNIVERLEGFSPLDDATPATERLQRIKEVRQKATDLKFQACYRNKASHDLIQQTIAADKDVREHKDDASYIAPKLRYKLPDSMSCANPSVVSDERTDAEKELDAKQEQFDKKYNGLTDPVSYFVNFKVVGVSPSNPTGNDQQLRNLNDVVHSLLSIDGIGQAIPAALYQQMPDKERYSDLFFYQPLYAFGNEDNIARFVEFASAKDATDFIDQQSCKMQYDNTCQPAGRPYQTIFVSGNSIALQDIRSKTEVIYWYAIAAITLLASIVMWLSIGKTVADGRRESAVFRAIGFRRGDIASIFTVYTLMLSVLVVAVALVVGFGAAILLDNMYAAQVTAEMQYQFGGINLDKQANLMAIDYMQLASVVAVAILSGLLGLIVPLLRNVRRNPIKDLRDE